MTATIEHLSEAGPISPDAVLGAAIGDKPRAAVVITIGSDDRASTTWSTMTNGELCVALVALQNAISEHMKWGN